MKMLFIEIPVVVFFTAIWSVLALLVFVVNPVQVSLWSILKRGALSVFGYIFIQISFSILFISMLRAYSIFSGLYSYSPVAFIGFSTLLWISLVFLSSSIFSVICNKLSKRIAIKEVEIYRELVLHSYNWEGPGIETNLIVNIQRSLIAILNTFSAKNSNLLNKYALELGRKTAFKLRQALSSGDINRIFEIHKIQIATEIKKDPGVLFIRNEMRKIYILLQHYEYSYLLSFQEQIDKDHIVESWDGNERRTTGINLDFVENGKRVEDDVLRTFILKDPKKMYSEYNIS